ncbi:MAG: hypothetical protein PHH37_04375 [Paludibacter sp.]|nr:hypothetical protein [Paludibacter sp.]
MKHSSNLIPIITIIFLLPTNIFAKEISSLKNQKIEKISLRIDDKLWIQGTKHEIGLVAFTTEGDISRTKGMLKGKLSWKNFKTETDGIEIRNGKISITKTNSSEYKSYIPVSFYSVYEPEKVFRDTIRLNYETEIKLFPINKITYSPGAIVKFGINIHYNNGEIKTYKNIRKVDQLLENYNIFVRSAQFRKSEFIVNEDPIDINGHRSGIMFELKRDSNIFDILEIELDYKEHYNYYANGRSGMFGFSGSSGSSGSTEQHGQAGQDGEAGEHGGNGDDLDIYVDAYEDSILGQTMVRTYIGNLRNNQAKRYLINPLGGNISVLTTGGSGGNGGDGGRGGDGGNGKNGDYYTEEIKEVIITKDTAGREIKTEEIRTITRQKPGDDGGRGGDGGWGAPGGNGGNGGYIIVYYTPAAKQYLNLLDINTTGGHGGFGGDGNSGGNGGKGGNGSPNGRTGRHGRNGAEGPSGYSGINGPVEYKPIDEIPWE